MIQKIREYLGNVGNVIKIKLIFNKNEIINQHFRPASILFVPRYVKHNTSLGIKCTIKALVKLRDLEAGTSLEL